MQVWRVSHSRARSSWKGVMEQRVLIEGRAIGAASDRSSQRQKWTEGRWDRRQWYTGLTDSFHPFLIYLLTLQEKQTYIIGASGGRVFDSRNSKCDFVIRPNIFQRAHV